MDMEMGAGGELHEFDWTIRYESIAPDCVDKLVRLVNRQYPGPEIRVKVGDRVRVHVRNQLSSEMVTIHWHGIYHRENIVMDGSGGLNQCGIPPGGDFVYEFPIEEDQSPGTYMWHAHVGTLRDDGLVGPFIVEPRDGQQDPYPSYDEDRVLVVQDWYHISNHAMAGFSSGVNVGEAVIPGATGPPYSGRTHQFDIAFGNSVVINGMGHFDCDTNSGTQVRNYLPPVCGTRNVDAGRFGPPTGVPVDICPGRHVIDVEPNKTYRLRMIAPGYHNLLEMKLEGHGMQVIEVDGHPVAPGTPLSEIDLMTGSRISVLITTDQTVGNYWLSSQSVNLPDWHPDIKGAAILRYSGASASDPPTDLTTFHPRTFGAERPPSFWLAKAVTYYAHQAPVVDDDFPENAEVDTRIVLNKQLENLMVDSVTGLLVPPSPPDYATYGPGDHRLWGTFNRMMGVGPSGKYVLGDVLHNGWANYENRDNWFFFNVGEVVDLVFNNYATDNQGLCLMHAWHMHGDNFWEVGHGFDEWTGSQEQIDALSHGGRPKKDIAVAWTDNEVALTFPEGGAPYPTFVDMGITPFDQGDNKHSCGYQVIRFRAENPGIWPLHCHMTLHQAFGMQIVLVVGKDQISVPQGYETCM